MSRRVPGQSRECTTPYQLRGHRTWPGNDQPNQESAQTGLGEYPKCGRQRDRWFLNPSCDDIFIQQLYRQSKRAIQAARAGDCARATRIAGAARLQVPRCKFSRAADSGRGKPMRRTHPGAGRTISMSTAEKPELKRSHGALHQLRGREVATPFSGEAPSGRRGNGGPLCLAPPERYSRRPNQTRGRRCWHRQLRGLNRVERARLAPRLNDSSRRDLLSDRPLCHPA